MNFLLLDLFKDFHFNSPHPESEQTGSLLLTNQYTTLHEKCPNTEFFQVRSFPVFGSEKTPYFDTFYAVLMRIFAKLSSHSEVFLEKSFLKICSKIYRRTTMPKCDFNKVALQLYWNHFLAWVVSCKFAAYFQNSFSKNTSGQLLLRLLKYLH